MRTFKKNVCVIRAQPRPSGCLIKMPVKGVNPLLLELIFKLKCIAWYLFLLHFTCGASTSQGCLLLFWWETDRRSLNKSEEHCVSVGCSDVAHRSECSTCTDSLIQHSLPPANEVQWIYKSNSGQVTTEFITYYCNLFVFLQMSLSRPKQACCLRTT